MKLLSIAVPSYNSEAYLNKCVDSLLKGGERVEILIINDGSSDRTKEIASEYEKEHPTVVRVINQENLGHGGAINSAVRESTGKYFKVVDSDDTLDEAALTAMLDKLDETDVDMLISNYKYTHANEAEDRVIGYRSSLPVGKVIGWSEIGKFRVEQYLTIHSVIFKLHKIRESKVQLPIHVFYEDNVFVYSVLPYVNKLLYLDVDLYNYTIGREGQSVQEDIIKRRYRHQILASKTIFTSHRLSEIANVKLRRYMYHECVMLLAIASVFTRLNRTDEAEDDLRNMWRECEAFDSKTARRIKKRSITTLVNLNGKAGREFGLMLYSLARRFMKFN